MTKPITIYVHASGPNPWKVVIIFEELNIPYEIKIVPQADLKKPAYEKLNPNGRAPTIQDPNTGLTLWESGAIVEYLIETYDKEHKLTYTTFPEKWLLKQWLAFQISGQGPYYGQAAFFAHFHPEHDEGALRRYYEQTKRVFGVLDRHLSEKGGEYLVGDKCTYADLSFVTWDFLVPWFFKDEASSLEPDKNYPAYWAWVQRLRERPAAQRALKEREAAMAKKE